MFTSICFRLYWRLPLLQKYIQSLLCCFVKIERIILQSQIACHTILCLSQPRPLHSWIMETLDMTKELGLFYAFFLTVSLYIQWYQFIIIQVTLPTPSHWFPSSFMLVFKSLHLNSLDIVTLLTLKVVFVDHPTILKTI